MQSAIFPFSAPAAAPPLPVNFRYLPLICRRANSKIFDHNIIGRPFSPSTRKLSRKLICKPPAGKYLSEDYLVLAVEYENSALIIKVDTDHEYEFARDMQVRGLPTLYFISPDPNKYAIRTEGLIPIQMMRSILENDM